MEVPTGYTRDEIESANERFGTVASKKDYNRKKKIFKMYRFPFPAKCHYQVSLSQ